MRVFENVSIWVVVAIILQSVLVVLYRRLDLGQGQSFADLVLSVIRSVKSGDEA
jgi:hypothetical protein